MTIAEVQTAIAAERALGSKVYGVKVNPQDRNSLVQQVVTTSTPPVKAVIANDDGFRTLRILGARIVGRSVVPVGTFVIVASFDPIDLDDQGT